jgi:signal transduction histidine kinase
MNFIFNSYATTLIFWGTATLLLSYYVYRREGVAVRWFGLMMCSNAIWSLGYGMELASSSLAQMKFFINIEYLGISSLPLSWFLFCLELSGKNSWLRTRLNMWLLVALPVITTLLVWTNGYHHLYYKALSVSLEPPFPMLVINPGLFYIIFTIYFYVLLAIGSYLLIMKFKQEDKIYKKQNYSIVIAVLFPWTANVIYRLGLSPIGSLDITPFAFIITILLISVGIYRFKLFDILPVAREKVLELMQDGFMVLDWQHRVIDYNFAFKKYVGNPGNKKIIGVSVESLFPNQSLLIDYINHHKSGKIELMVSNQIGTFDLEADVSYLNHQSLRSEATIIKLQDLTNLRQEALKSKVQAMELQRLNHLKDRIFSIIAHDLRGPLVNLSEILKMFSNGVISIEEFKELSPKLNTDIIYTTDLLENILHWSRSQLKGFGVNKEYFDLRNLIINEINYHKPSASTKKIEIVHDVFPGQMVYADLLMIQIVVRNILNNAIKFCKEGCEIHFFASYINEYMVLRIKDNGTGMPSEVVNKIFKGDHITTRGTSNEKGTGLGLMVCKEFMHKNDGDIKVDSTDGVGTMFTISIPVEPAEVKEALLITI